MYSTVLHGLSEIEMDTDHTNILSCPSCGDNSLPEAVHSTPWYNVSCPECGMRGPGAGTAESAIDKWNSLPRHLVATKDVPTETGAYWNYTERHPEEICIVNLSRSKIESIRPGREFWAGPVPLPVNYPVLKGESSETQGD